NDGVAEAGNEAVDIDGGTPLAVLSYLAKSLANEPDSVVIDTEERRGGMRLNLHVAPDDMGRVIGRRGRTAQAIRTLVNVAGAKDGVQASVDIVDD
ncbi:MAG TPA: KH domain-containing protein, partial [Acidimicrobiales bacterium]